MGQGGAHVRGRAIHTWGSGRGTCVVVQGGTRCPKRVNPPPLPWNTWRIRYLDLTPPPDLIPSPWITDLTPLPLYLILLVLDPAPDPRAPGSWIQVCGGIEVHWSLGGPAPAALPGCQYMGSNSTGAHNTSATVVHWAVQTDMVGQVGTRGVAGVGGWGLSGALGGADGHGRTGGHKGWGLGVGGWGMGVQASVGL